MDLVDFEGGEHGPFSETIDLLGDGSVLLISTPGHTRGHMHGCRRAATNSESHDGWCTGSVTSLVSSDRTRSQRPSGSE